MLIIIIIVNITLILTIINNIMFIFLFFHSFINGVFKIKEITELNLKHNEITTVQCVYGIVQTVFESKLTKFKHLNVIDATHSEGIYINVKKFLDKISVRSIIKINSLAITKIAGKIEYFFNQHSSAIFLPLFTFDYDNLNVNERNKILTETIFKDLQDREVARELEEWYSLQIFETSLSNINHANSYINLACQVLCYTKSSLCINALIWDGTTPNFSLPVCAFNDPNESSPVHFDGINFEYFPFTLGRFFLLNVWKDSKSSGEHYEIFKCLSLRNGNDLLVLFNIQLIYDPNNMTTCSLAMRSSMKCGKAVRLCNRNSILGKMLMKRIEISLGKTKQAVFSSPMIESSLPLVDQVDTNECSEDATELLSDFQDLENSSQITSEAEKVEVDVEIEETSSSYDESEDDEIRHLKEKGKPFIVYESLLKMGLPSLHQYYKLQENEEDEDNFYPITREERLKLIQYAINELRNELPSKSFSFSFSDKSISLSNSYDSLMSEELDTP